MSGRSGGSQAAPRRRPVRWWWFGSALLAGLVAVGVVLAVVGVPPFGRGGPPDADAPGEGASAPVDEVKYAYGDRPGEVVFSWRGAERTIWYGPDPSYGSVATATDSAIVPLDVAGPFREATLTGLEPGRTYHYRIGRHGAPGTFSTAAGVDDSFRAVAVMDTIASTCRPYQAQLNELVRAQRANFMIHGGDLAIANECGAAAVHQFYLDLEPFSRAAAFMPAWGNHEYGPPAPQAPPGTPRDTLANYKGRSALPNARRIPNDTPAQTGHPGCGREAGSATNTCLGEDWGWFTAGRVLFVSYPEPAPGAIEDWYTQVAALMTKAQADPAVEFVITYGHYPLLSSTDWQPPPGYQAAFAALGDRFGAGSVPGGKYVLNLSGHRHTLEVFGADRAVTHGVTHVVNGGGGQGLIPFQTVLPGSTFRAKHLGFSRLDYEASAHRLTLAIICGPEHPGEGSHCPAGSILFTRSFAAGTSATG